MIYIGSDDIGFYDKKRLLHYLKQRGYKVSDLGPDNDKKVDFPKFAEKVCRKVASDPYNRGVLLSGTGIGMSMVANKFKGIYAALVYNEVLAEKARRENNSNVLCLPTEYISSDSANSIVSIWLSTSFSGTDDSTRHIKLIKEIEKNG